MKFGLGGKQFIEFSTDVEGLERVAPVQKSTHFTPQWFKEMKDYIPQQPTPDGSVPGRYGKSEETSKKWSSGTVKRCPAIIDLITEGFIIPMWCDFLLQRDNQIL